MDAEVGVIGRLRQAAGRRRCNHQILDDEVPVLVHEEIRPTRRAAECEVGAHVDVMTRFRLDFDVRRDAAGCCGTGKEHFLQIRMAVTAAVSHKRAHRGPCPGDEPHVASQRFPCERAAAWIRQRGRVNCRAHAGHH